MPRPGKQNVAAPDVGTPDAPALASFDDFVGSIPPDRRISIALSRLTSDLHPHLAMPERIFPAPQLGSCEEMIEETARRHQAGEYVLNVCLHGDGGRIEKRNSIKFRIGASAFAPAGGQIRAPLLGEEELPPEEPPDTLATLETMLLRRARIRELRELGGEGSEMNVTKTIVETITALKQLLPPPASVTAPAVGTDSVGTITLLKEMFALFQQVAPEGAAPAGFWTAAMPHIADLLKSWGPYLPHVAAALAQAKQAGAGMGVLPVPETNPPALPGVNVSALLPLTGGNPMHELTLKTFLDMAFVEARKEHTPGSARVAYDLLAGYADGNFPSVLDHLAGMPVDEMLATWGRLDPRMLTEPRTKGFCEGFHAFLRETPPPVEAPPAGGLGGGKT